jgi:tetratricopeptide (TPR) repeat protein
LFTPHEAIKYLLQLEEIDNQWPHLYYDLGWNYFDLQQYDKSITEYEKALELYDKWGIKPWWDIEYCALGNAYHKTGQYKKEKKLYKKAEQDFPDDMWIISYKTILLLSERDTVEANRYLDKCISICQDNSLSPADIKTKLAWIYSESGIPDKAEEFYRQALSLEPGNLFRVNNLAYFLINKDRNVTEGMKLIDHALELSPDYYSYLDTKGWGLYKLGKYPEALELLQKSWNLRMKDAIYDSEAFSLLEAAKKAVTEQK